MINYFKYLPFSKEDEKWGLCVLNTGCTHIKGSDEYPLRQHPSHHFFRWDDWRVLEEYQIIYIANGHGVFESASVRLTEVKPGTIIFLFPNERHRYKPDNGGGWDEYWVGVSGKIIDSLFHTGFIKPDAACFHIGCNERVRNLFEIIMDNAREKSIDYQPLVSGAVMHLIGEYHAAVKQSLVSYRVEEEMMKKAMELFRVHLAQSYSPEQAAMDLNLSYSTFRRLFKLYAGMPPGQYYLQLKINEAAELLKKGDLLVKEICASMNFDSAHYFSRVFKEKTGFTPTKYRNAHLITKT
jgi:AraC-like DNA-binding protein